MIKIKIYSLIIAALYCGVLNADNYAILISAGKATSDNESTNSEYWYDLFLAYEYLLLNENYDSTNVYVFYGDGIDYNTYNVRYKKELHNWGQITDYDNSYSTLSYRIPSLNDIITDEDNLLFYWVVGHGQKVDPSNDDSYKVTIEHSIDDKEYIFKFQLASIINSITHYNKRKIIWMTCESGAMGGGSININNNRTTLITSSASSENSYSHEHYRNYIYSIHSDFNYGLFSLSTGYFPDGTTCSLNQYCPNEAITDSLLSVNELHAGIFTFISLNSEYNQHPCIFDMGNISNKIFLGEKKELKNVYIDNYNSYWLDNMELSGVEFSNGIDVIINTDVKSLIKNNTYVPAGTSLIIE